jgi:hypothetical protein
MGNELRESYRNQKEVDMASLEALVKFAHSGVADGAWLNSIEANVHPANTSLISGIFTRAGMEKGKDYYISKGNGIDNISINEVGITKLLDRGAKIPVVDAMLGKVQKEPEKTGLWASRGKS